MVAIIKFTSQRLHHCMKFFEGVVMVVELTLIHKEGSPSMHSSHKKLYS